MPKRPEPTRDTIVYTRLSQPELAHLAMLMKHIGCHRSEAIRYCIQKDMGSSPPGYDEELYRSDYDDQANHIPE